MTDSFGGHPNLSEEINENIKNIMESNILGGVYLKDIAIGGGLKIITKNSLYTLRRVSDQVYTIQGHERFCAKETFCVVHGSTWGGSLIKMGFIGRGMLLEFSTDSYNNVTTSKIHEIDSL